MGIDRAPRKALTFMRTLCIKAYLLTNTLLSYGLQIYS